MKIGYARVSTNEQSTDLQHEQLKALGCEKIFEENKTGANTSREQLQELIAFARSGDVIHVMKVDRLARNTIDALTIADELKIKGVGLTFEDLGGVDINSDIGRVVYTTISAFAEMERKRIQQRCSEGRAKAKSEGKHMGRRTNQAQHIQIMELFNKGIPKATIAKELGCSRGTVYNAIKAH